MMDVRRVMSDVSKFQAIARDVQRVLSAAYELNGDCDKTVAWFKDHPIADFDNLTAMHLVGAGKTQAVIDYLWSLSEVAS